jgi:hypothetical protein
VNANIVGDRDRWLELIGHANAAAFDRYGWMYYSRDVYDLYYPGYHDTWPSLNGAIGMTFESDGGGYRGVLWRRDDGTLLSLRDGIAKHFVASLATIEATSSHAEERVRDYLAFRRRAVTDGRSGPIRRVIIAPARDPARAAELVSTLLRAGIEVRRASAGFATARAHAYADDAVSTHRFEAGAFVVDLDQPQGKLAKAILEPASALDSTFARAQIAKFERNQRRGKRAEGEEYEFYDVTAWSLPVAFGVDAYWTDDASPVAGDLLMLPTDESAPQPLRRVAGELSVDGGGIVAGHGATSAYLFGPERNGASKLAYQLLADGFRVGVASQPLDAGGRQWPRGTYVVRVARNDSTLTARIDTLARASAVEVTGVNTAQAGTGQYGIGSETILAIPAPNIAVIADEGVSQTDYGAVWYSLERRYGVRFTPIAMADLDRDLSKYTAILFPSGRYTRVSKDALERIRTWVRGGGTLVTMGAASAGAAEEGVALTSARRVAAEPESTATKPEPAPARPSAPAGAGAPGSAAKPASAPESHDRLAQELIPYQSTSASNDTPETVPGIHADVLLDRTHWLTAGYDAPRLTVLVEGDTFLRPSKEGENVAIFPTTGPLVRAGFTWPGNTERLLRGTALLIDEPTGAGHVVLFANEPLFRGWWRALDKLVLNALLLGAAY